MAIFPENSVKGNLALTFAVRGDIPGMSVVNKFGRNPDIDTATVPEDVWNGGGSYTGFPTGSAETVQVLSDNAADTSAGTGTRTVLITGLDSNYAVITETFTLNGTTPVTGSSQFIRVHTARVVTAGSGGVNAGQITVRHSTTTTNVFLVLPVGGNQSYNSGYTVPAGKTAYLVRVHADIRDSGTTATADIAVWIREFGGVARLRRPYAISTGSRVDDVISGGISLPEKTDIILRVNYASANNLVCAAGYDLILIDN